MNEAETRAEHINPALAAAGWGIVEGSHIRREYPITLGRLEGEGKRGKALTADYVLVYRNTSMPSANCSMWLKAVKFFESHLFIANHLASQNFKNMSRKPSCC